MYSVISKLPGGRDVPNANPAYMHAFLDDHLVTYSVHGCKMLDILVVPHHSQINIRKNGVVSTHDNLGSRLSVGGGGERKREREDCARILFLRWILGSSCLSFKKKAQHCSQQTKLYTSKDSLSLHKLTLHQVWSTSVIVQGVQDRAR